MNTRSNTTRHLQLLGAFTVAALLAANTHAQPFGQWDFNSSNLTATVGSPLTFVGGPGGLTDLNTAFGTTTGFGIPNIGGTNAVVMRFPAATNGMGYNMVTPGPNGGSTVNQYTLIMDVLYPSASDAKIRPLIQTEDGTHLGSQQFLVVDTSNGVGPRKIGSGGVTGPYVGSLAPNTWYRLGLVVTAGDTIRVFADGQEIGSFDGGAADGFFALNPSATALILADTANSAALGYVNSIQIRDSALTAGQMAALGAASAAGIPSVIPPVPSYILSRDPGNGATGIAPLPNISVVLDQGDTIVNSGSIVLKLDGVAVGTMTPTPPTFTVNYTVTNTLEPLSVHTLSLTWSDNVVGLKTNTWNFTVQQYQVVKLPAPFYFENFDGVAETTLPAGWYATNNTQTDIAGANLANPRSDSYKDWVNITTNTLFTAKDADPLIVPPIMVNGSFLTAMANNQLVYAESDSRNGSQVQMLFATNITCLGKSNVFLSFHSIYQQNQDSIGAVEYSINQGATWLPALYMLTDGGGEFDIIRTNGVIDVGATFNTPRTDQAYGSNYGFFIGAQVSTALIPFISSRINDDNVESIRVEVIRLAQADNQPNVWLRFMQAGTASWWFGIDEVGLYEINAPVINTQPQSQTVDAGTQVTFTVVATGTPAPTYQWQFNNTNISGQTGSSYTFIAETNKAGPYRCVVSNTFGVLNSSAATLTVISAPKILLHPVSQAVNAGAGSTFTVAVRGRAPISYQWTKNGSPVAGQTTFRYIIGNAQLANVGQYACVFSNSDGSITSRVAQLTIVTNITQDLVVHLKFDTDYNDSSGRNNHGTSIGTTALAPGKIGNALLWTEPQGQPETNYVTLGIPADLHMVDSVSFSASFWYKANTNNRAGDPAILANKDWDSGSNLGFVIWQQGNGLRYNYRELDVAGELNTRKDSATSATIEDGNWHHCVVVFNRGGSGATYVDGNLITVASLLTAAPAAVGGVYAPTTIDCDPPTNRVATSTGAWNIGEDGSGWYGKHDNVGITNAMIDDLGIWRRALTPAEVQAIYIAGNAGNPLNTAAPITNPTPLNPSISFSGGNVVISKANYMLFSAPAITGLWTEVTAARSTNSYTEIPAGRKYYRGNQP
jgi:hypothetical protein